VLRWWSRTQVFMERAEGLELAMVRIPAGRFVMGSPEGEAERQEWEGPQHEVELGEFLMERTPITQAQWRAVALWEPRAGENWERKLEPQPRGLPPCVTERPRFPSTSESGDSPWATLAIFAL
jgi:formylglycine-generating enzyme required for sulfatase activity